jgi:hypothetical protein
MSGQPPEFSVAIDRKTSWSICAAVGERLQRSLPPVASHPSRQLEQLMDELRRQERTRSQAK